METLDSLFNSDEFICSNRFQTQFVQFTAWQSGDSQSERLKNSFIFEPLKLEWCAQVSIKFLHLKLICLRIIEKFLKSQAMERKSFTLKKVWAFFAGSKGHHGILLHFFLNIQTSLCFCCCLHYSTVNGSLCTKSSIICEWEWVYCPHPGER